MINSARLVSVPQPTTVNPLGLQASVAVITSVCYLHTQELRREMYASLYGAPPFGWPALIDWKIVLERGLSFKHDLQQIVYDVDKRWQESPPLQQNLNSFHEDSDQLRRHPRMESYFWKSVTNDILVHGHGYVDTMDGYMEIARRASPG